MESLFYGTSSLAKTIEAVFADTLSTHTHTFHFAIMFDPVFVSTLYEPLCFLVAYCFD